MKLNDISDVVKKETIDYQGSPSKFESNAKKALAGAAAAGCVYLAAGLAPAVIALAGGYALLKGYQALKDKKSDTP